MEINRINGIILIIFYLLSGETFGLQSEFSIIIEPGTRECFYQILKQDLDIYFDFQVIQGGEMDISFWLNSPSNRVLVTDLKKTQGQHHFKTQENGEYRFCFDNSISRFAQKQVFFYLYSPDEFIDPEFPIKNDDDTQKINKDDLGELDNQIETFKSRFTSVQDNLEHAQRLQAQFKVFEHIDRIVMEDNYERVNFWSIINICLMLVVGIVQVVMIRSLFEDRSKIGKILRSGKASLNK